MQQGVSIAAAAHSEAFCDPLYRERRLRPQPRCQSHFGRIAFGLGCEIGFVPLPLFQFRCENLFPNTSAVAPRMWANAADGGKGHGRAQRVPTEPW